MNNFVLSIFLLCYTVVGVVSSSYAQSVSEQTLIGHTSSLHNNEVVQLASVINLSSSKRAISNRQGFFKIPILHNDTLFISAIGYQSITIICSNLSPGDTIKIKMKPTHVALKEVVIISSNPKRDSIARAAAEFLKTDPLMNNHDRILNRPRGSLTSPLTALYERFSKEGQDNVRFEEFLAYAERQKQVDRRFNKAFVKRATGLDEKYLDEFMLFCKPDKEFVIRASEYELIQATRKCADEFKMQR